MEWIRAVVCRSLERLKLETVHVRGYIKLYEASPAPRSLGDSHRLGTRYKFDYSKRDFCDVFAY